MTPVSGRTCVVPKLRIAASAEWIWNLAAEVPPQCGRMVGLYGRRRHRRAMARRLHTRDEAKREARRKVHPRRLLDNGKIDMLAALFHP
jgi:hypothetical protein